MRANKLFRRKMDKLRVATFNVRGLQNRNKRREVFIWIKRQKVDIAFLQETHNIKKTDHLWRSEWGGKAWFAGGDSRNRGVGILINRDLDGKILEVDRDINGRYIVVKWEYNKKIYLLVCVY